MDEKVRSSYLQVQGDGAEGVQHQEIVLGSEAHPDQVDAEILEGVQPDSQG